MGLDGEVVHPVVVDDGRALQLERLGRPRELVQQGVVADVQVLDGLDSLESNQVDEIGVVANGEPSNLVASESVMSMQADGFYRVDDDEFLSVDEFLERYQTVHAVCGIGNPTRFFATLHSLGLTAIQHVYRDHHAYTGAEVNFDDGLAAVCTEKDGAKLKHLERRLDNVWYLRVSVALPEEATRRLTELLDARAIVPRRETSEEQLHG